MKDALSVITICFNNLEELVRTCDSVDRQTTLPDEHLIIDGSVDKEILNWLQTIPQPAYRKWIHERDNGISDAFNKGVKKSTGTIIQLLNSGDVYYDNGVLQKVAAVFENNESLSWCHGKLNLFRGRHWVIIGKPFEKEKLYRGMRSTFHPTMFVKKELFEKHGFFDTSLKIAMDYDFLIRISNEKFEFLNHPLVSFDPGGVSNSNYLGSLDETKKCYEKYFGKSRKLGLWQLRLKFLHYLLSSFAGKWLYSVKKRMKLENI